MEEINLTELFRYYLRKLPIIILLTLLSLLVGYIYVKDIQVPMYHGTTTIILVQKMDENQQANVTQSELTVNEKLVSTYSQIMKSRRVLDQVISSLDLDITADKLAHKISVTSVSETSIIKVTVSDENKILAVDIANELAKVFSKEIITIYNLENISIIDKAIIEDNPYNVNLIKQLFIASLIGFVLSCGIVFVIYYFDNRVKNKKEIETKLNIAVLGEIPVATKLEATEKKRNKKRNASFEDETNDLDFDIVDETITSKNTRRKKDKEGEE